MKLHDPKPFVRRAAAATLGDGLRAREIDIVFADIKIIQDLFICTLDYKTRSMSSSHNSQPA